MRFNDYWDNDFDRKFDEALDELAKEELRQGYTDEELEEMYQEDRYKQGNPMVLYGAI